MDDSRRDLFVLFALVVAVALAVPAVGPHVVDAVGDRVSVGSYRGVDVSPVEDEDAVRGEIVAYENLTDAERRLFDEARVDGPVSIDGGDGDGLLRYDAVRYEGTLYRVTEVAS